ncbi:MAG: adenylate kinase [bacterium]
MEKLPLIIFGAPGVGKGTQAKIIAEKLNLFHISTGDILRRAVGNKTEMGMKAQSYMDKGELVPDEIMAGIIKDALNDKSAEHGFILDGFPRNVDQAELLDKTFAQTEISHPMVISLDADDEVIIGRLSQRRQCSSCSNIVSLALLEDKSKCPICGAENSFIKRRDDEEGVIRNRLRVFHEQTTPVLEFYKKKCDVIFVDGTAEIDVVTDSILKAITIK